MINKNYIQISSDTLIANLDLVSFKNDECVIMYAPALDLSGYGVNIEDAKASFEIALKEYITYAISNNTLEADLYQKGWRKQVRNKIVISPSFSAILRRNSNLRTIVNENAFNKNTYGIQLAI